MFVEFQIGNRRNYPDSGNQLLIKGVIDSEAA